MPLGALKVSNCGGWNVGPCCVANVDDVAFAKALVTDVEKVACIDPKRVYAVGFSMGGGMTHYIGCHAADVFAAVGRCEYWLALAKEVHAPLSPSATRDTSRTQARPSVRNPGRTVPSLCFHGCSNLAVRSLHTQTGLDSAC